MTNSTKRLSEVAIPAPTTPKAGKPNRPKINRLLNTKLMPMAIMLARMGSVVWPDSRMV